MHNRHPPLTTTTTGHDGSVRLELDKQGVGRRMREGIDDKAFPEQGVKVSIHSDGSFESLGCVLANTNLNVLTAVFYWFTLKRDEPQQDGAKSDEYFSMQRGKSNKCCEFSLWIIVLLFQCEVEHQSENQ